MFRGGRPPTCARVVYFVLRSAPCFSIGTNDTMQIEPLTDITYGKRKACGVLASGSSFSRGCCRQPRRLLTLPVLPVLSSRPDTRGANPAPRRFLNSFGSMRAARTDQHQDLFIVATTNELTFFDSGLTPGLSYQTVMKRPHGCPALGAEFCSRSNNLETARLSAWLMGYFVVPPPGRSPPNRVVDRGFGRHEAGSRRGRTMSPGVCNLPKRWIEVAGVSAREETTGDHSGPMP